MSFVFFVVKSLRIRLLPAGHLNVNTKDYSVSFAIQNSVPVEQASPWTDRAIERGIFFLLIFTPLAFGTTQDWSIAIMEITAFLIFGVWLIKYRETPLMHKAQPRSKGLPALLLVFCGAVLVGIVVLQIIPMPRDLLNLLSPKTTELYQTFLEGDLTSWRTISTAPHASVSGIILFLSYASVFTVVLQHYNTEEKIQGLFRLIIVIGCSLAVLAVLTRVFRNGNVMWIFPVRAGEKAMGPYINKNHFAGYMEMVIPIAMSYYLYTAGKMVLPSKEQNASRVQQALSFLDNRKFASLSQGMVAVLLLTGGLFMSLSRGGISGYAVSMAVFAWMVRSRRSLRKRAVFMALLGGVVAIAVIVAGWSMFEARLETSEQQGTMRIGTWTDAFSLARNFPLFGTGWGTFEKIYPAYQTAHPDLNFEHAENEYVEVLTDAGWIGLVALLGTMASGCFIILQRWRERHNTFVVSFTVGGITAFSAIIVHSLLDFNMRVPANALLMTVILALTWAILFKVPSRREQKAGLD